MEKETKKDTEDKKEIKENDDERFNRLKAEENKIKIPEKKFL